MAKPKIAYCIPGLYTPGGMERVLSVKANYLADVLDYEVVVIITEGKGKEYAFPISTKVKVINLDLNYDSIYNYPLYKKIPSYLFKQYKFKKRLTAALKQEKPDITLSMLRRDINFITSIKDGSKKIGELHFNRINYRDFGINAGKKTANVAIKFVKQISAHFWMKRLIGKLRKLDRFVVLSEEDKLNWPELNNVSVIYNPLFDFPDKISECKSKKVIAAGRVVWQKGFDMLLDSWKIVNERFPDWDLWIYGSGSKDALEQQANLLGISKSCHFMYSTNDLNSKFIESSILAFSSRFEGFGMVITEAMSCGVPPVAFSCPCGPKDIISDGIDGFLVNPGDVKTMADKISQLIEDEELRKTMGKQARERSKSFSKEIIFRLWEELFEEVLASR